MEITDRGDVGVDLKAPQRDDSGAEKWTYALLKEVAPGDIVLHWSTTERAVIGFSVADGEWGKSPSSGARTARRLVPQVSSRTHGQHSPRTDLIHATASKDHESCSAANNATRCSACVASS